MRIGIVPHNPMERLVLALGVAPEPIMETQMAFTMARAIMAGVELGIFEAIGAGSHTAAKIAESCRTDARATQALLDSLVASRYLGYAKGRYELKPVARKWLLKSSPQSIAHKILFQKLEWDIVGKLEDFVRTGQPLDLHHTGGEEMWKSYQAGMADLGRMALAETMTRTHVPAEAKAMLDIGGSGGTYSAAFLRKYPSLQSTILELPAAVPHARPAVEAHGLGERLQIRAGDVLEEDLGQGKYDFIFMGNVAHHLSDEQNREVARKAFAALRPGGAFCVHDATRTKSPSPKNQVGSLLDLYFAMTSHSGTWTVEQMSAWLKDAGFRVGKPVKFRTMPGFAQVWGTRSR